MSTTFMARTRMAIHNRAAHSPIVHSAMAALEMGCSFDEVLAGLIATLDEHNRSLTKLLGDAVERDPGVATRVLVLGRQPAGEQHLASLEQT